MNTPTQAEIRKLVREGECLLIDDLTKQMIREILSENEGEI